MPDALDSKVANGKAMIDLADNIPKWIPNAFVICCFLVVGCNAETDTPRQQTDLVFNVDTLKERNPVNFQKELDRLFEKDLSIDENFTDSTIVVVAKWRQLLKSTGGNQRSNEKMLSDFLTVLKEQIEVESFPGWWERTFLSLDFVNGRLHSMKRHHVGLPSRQDLGVSTELVDEIVNVWWDDYHVSFDFYELKEATFGTDGATLYVANHAMFPGTYDLLSIDGISNQRNWSTRVWCEYSMNYSGGHEHLSQVLIDGQRITVVGASTGVVYVEQFSAEDGGVLFRFSTDYCSP